MSEAVQSDRDLVDIVFRHAAEGMAITDAAGRVLAVNDAFTQLTGYTADDIRGRTLNLLSSGRHSPEFYAEMWKTLAERGRWQGEIWNRRKNGDIYAEWLSISDVHDPQGKLSHYIGVFTDISQIMESQSQLRFLAHHDPATQLPNRTLFNDRFDQAVRRALRDLRQLAILFIDIDQMRKLGDTLGHAVSNKLVIEVARQMGDAIRDTDTLARLGSSEFILLIEEVDGPRSASLMADKLLKNFEAPVPLGDDQVFVAASIGISLFPMDGQDLATLIANADTAMHEARSQGRNTYRFYSDEMSAYANERMMLERLLRQAIDQQELSLHFQPQFDATSLELVGVEALLRWHNPVLGMVGPERFVPVAEDIGLIHPIGEWVLRHACRQFVAWQNQGIAPPTLSINISARQIELGNFVEMVEQVLTETGLAGRCLELEVTESVLTDVAYVVPTIEALRQSGIRISIDDFGTGFSSLAYLRDLPIHRLKIDRSFVLDIGRDSGNEKIVRTIIGMARTLGLNVIAEGVETETQAEFLRREGCDDFQGHLLGRAVAATDFGQYFAARRKG